MKNLPQTKYAWASFSECGKFRYSLIKSDQISPLHRDLLLWIMLNPSTATTEEDDPTVRKCQVFAYKWGYRGVIITNLYAIRATDPKSLLRAKPAELIGPENDNALELGIQKAQGIMVAWGSTPLPGIEDRVQAVSRFATHAGKSLYALKVNMNGSPKHPLYCRYTSTSVVWKP